MLVLPTSNRDVIPKYTKCKFSQDRWFVLLSAASGMELNAIATSIDQQIPL